MEAVYSLDGVSIVREDGPLLRDLNLEIRHGEHWCILGPNGSGKSTLLSIMALETWPTVGRVKILGKNFPGHPVHEIQSKIAFFQPGKLESLVSNYPGLTVIELILWGITKRLPIYKDPGESAIEKAQHTAANFLPHLSPGSRIRNLSSGERGRALLASLLTQRPQVLLLDEPFDSLDIASRTRLVTDLKEQSGALACSVMVVHRLEEVPPYASHAMLLKEGSEISRGPIHMVINDDNLTKTYDLPLHVERHPTGFHWTVGHLDIG